MITRKFISRLFDIPAGGGDAGSVLLEGSWGNSGGSVATNTITGVTPAGTNRLLVVTFDAYTCGTNNAVTFGGVPLTRLSTGPFFGSGVLEVWYLVNPSTSSASVVVTFDGTPGEQAAQAFAFSGVNQSAPLGATNGDYSDSTTVSVSPVTSVGDLAAFAVVSDDSIGSSPITPSAGLTLIRNQSNSESNSFYTAPGQAGTTPGSFTSATQMCAVGFAIHPA